MSQSEGTASEGPPQTALALYRTLPTPSTLFVSSLARVKPRVSFPLPYVPSELPSMFRDSVSSYGPQST